MPPHLSRQTQAHRGGVTWGIHTAGQGQDLENSCPASFSHSSPAGKGPWVPNSVPTAALVSYYGSVTFLFYPLVLPSLSAAFLLLSSPSPSCLPVTQAGGSGGQAHVQREVLRLGGRRGGEGSPTIPGVPRVGAETWALDLRRECTWPRCLRGDVRPRRARVPARSFAERGTKRPAHSCALTHGRHVARRCRR